MIMNRILVMAAMAVSAAVNAALAESTGETYLLEGWCFFKGKAPGAEKPSFDDSGWQSVRIPHDWAIDGEHACAYRTRGMQGQVAAR